MQYRLIKHRNRIFKQIWEENKDELTMEDLSEIFNCPLQSLYRVIRQKNESEKITK